jgi:hypothetical protein
MNNTTILNDTSILCDTFANPTATVDSKCVYIYPELYYVFMNDLNQTTTKEKTVYNYEEINDFTWLEQSNDLFNSHDLTEEESKDYTEIIFNMFEKTGRTFFD